MQKVFTTNRPIMTANVADRYTTIEDTLATNLTALGYTVYKRKGSVIRETDVFPCVVISPSEDGEDLGIEAMGGLSEFIYNFKVYYIQTYARDLAYTDLDSRYKIREDIYRIGQFSGTLSPTRVSIKGIQPFSINGSPNTVYSVTGFRMQYGFMEQGLI